MKYPYTMTTTLDTKGRFVRRPMVEVEIFGPKGIHRGLGIIDSGADLSLLNIEIAKIIGIDLTNATRYEMLGISGQKTPALLSVLKIKVEHLESPVEIPVAFIDSSSVDILLGQEGFFDLHRIRFEKDHKTFEVTPIRKK